MANANPADKQAKLQNAMSRAKKLIQLESNGTLDKIAAGVRDGVSSSLESGDIITEQLMTTPRNRRTEAPMVGAKMGENAMNVPAAIRNSFSTNPIDESSLYSAFGGAQGSNDDLAFLTEDVQIQQHGRSTLQWIRHTEHTHGADSCPTHLLLSRQNQR